MNDTSLLERITSDPAVMTGKPVIKGTRLTVEYVLSRLSSGTAEELLDEYERLPIDDIRACLLLGSISLT